MAGPNSATSRMNRRAAWPTSASLLRVAKPISAGLYQLMALTARPPVGHCAPPRGAANEESVGVSYFEPSAEVLGDCRSRIVEADRAIGPRMHELIHQRIDRVHHL